MHNFLHLILEGISFGKKKAPKVRPLTISRKVAAPTWKHTSIKPKRKRVIPQKPSLLSGKTLINQTERTRAVWDPQGYQAKKFYDNVYRKL